MVSTFFCLALLGCGGKGSPPETFTIREGETVTVAAEVAHEGDMIVCVRGGERVGGADVQKPGFGVGGSGVGTGPDGGGSINVGTREDGSVVASCHG